MKNSKIEWCDHTHNFWHGCTKVSEACRHYYAETVSKRFKRVEFGPGKPRWQPKVETRIDNPYKWDKMAKSLGIRYRVFTLSMGDFFDAEVPTSWRDEAWEVIRETPNLDWLILTKRPENIASMLPPDWGKDGWDNVWLGCTAEDQKSADKRIPILTSIPARIHFLSVEPLLESVKLDLTSIDWVIVGGESGPKSRPMQEEWVLDIKEQCRASKTAFFFMQWGGVRPKETGRLLKGRTYDAFPSLTPSFTDQFDAKGNLIGSDFWGSEYEKVGLQYITCKGGIVRLLCPDVCDDSCLAEMAKSKIIMLTLGKSAKQLAPNMVVGEEYVEIYFKDRSSNPLLLHQSIEFLDQRDQLPKSGSMTKLEIWKLENGKPVKKLTRKCKITAGTIPNLANIFG